MCSTERHKGHQFKPLKIYLDELYKRYRGGDNQYHEELEELEKRKIMLLVNLRNCVEKIAEEFSKLEEDIIFTYENIKTQIQENVSV
jgi:heme oxygenase